MLAFTVDGAPAATPRRDGDRVSFDRGTFVEVYDLGLDHVEQSFVLRAPTGGAEWRVRVDTDAAYAGRGAHELRFDAQGLGTVTYGDATIRDARGVTTSTTVRFEAGAIVIPLPANANDASRYPLVVDPLITTIPVDASNDTMAQQPDVAYSAGVNKFQVSYEHNHSGIDVDIFATRVDASGNVLETLIVDASDARSLAPRVSASGSHFMTTWTDVDEDGASQNKQVVRARARVAGSIAVSQTFKVSGTYQQVPESPAIGGNANGTFLIVWQERELSARRVLGRLATAAGPSAGDFEIDDTGECENPQVSERPNASGKWLVAYEQHGLYQSNPINIRARQVTTAGAPFSSGFAVTSFVSGTSRDPVVTTDGTNFLVAFDYAGVESQRDLFLRTVTWATNPALGPLINFSFTQLGADTFVRDEFDAALAFDGVRYAVAYTTRPSNNTSRDIRGATFFLTPSVVLQETNAPIAVGSEDVSRPRLVGCGLDIPGKHLVAWTSHEGNPDTDAVAGIWSTLGSGGVKVVDTGCGGPAEPLQACSNSACKIGLTGAAYFTAPSNTTFTFSIGNSPALVGSQMALQGMDFLVPSNATDTCPSGTQEFTVSDTLVFTVQ